MKRISLLILVMACATSLTFAQKNKIEAAKTPEKKTEIEMKKYVLVFLNTGPHRDQAEEEAEAIQKGHLAFLSKLAEEGLLIMAGPLMDDNNVRGILVLATSDMNDVKVRLEEDPAIKAGRLTPELHIWYTKSGTITLP
jgi:uncharacterized protein YciI